MSETCEDGALGSGVRAFATMVWLAMSIETEISVVEEDGSIRLPAYSRLLDCVRCGVLDDHGRAREHVRVHQTTHGVDCCYTS